MEVRKRKRRIARKIGSRGSKYVLKRRSRWNSGRRRRRRRESRGREDKKEVGRRRKMRKPGVVGDKDEEKDFGRGSYRT